VNRFLPLAVVVLLCSALAVLGWQSLQMPSALSSEAYSQMFGTDETIPGLTVAATIQPAPRLDTHYDVLVVGGTPSGVAAALAAARRGARVLLIEQRQHLGGDIVYTMLNMFDVPARPGEPSPVHGIFAEFFDQLGVSATSTVHSSFLKTQFRLNPISLGCRARGSRAS
jgi:hypothetical protein